MFYKDCVVKNFEESRGRGSRRGFFQLMFPNFSEHLFCRAPASGCFFIPDQNNLRRTKNLAQSFKT